MFSGEIKKGALVEIGRNFLPLQLWLGYISCIPAGCNLLKVNNINTNSKNNKDNKDKNNKDDNKVSRMTSVTSF